MQKLLMEIHKKGSPKSYLGSKEQKAMLAGVSQLGARKLNCAEQPCLQAFYRKNLLWYFWRV